MRRGRLNAEASLGLLGETHSVGRRKHWISSSFHDDISYCLLAHAAPTLSPRVPDLPQKIGPGINPYRPDARLQQQQVFDFDLDLNPDL
jgi:mediator of RNA polymerase II transcription subunit 4